MVYTSSSLSLAALEFLVHLSGPQDAPELVSFRIEFDAKLLTDVELPRDWRQLKLKDTRALGKVWVENAKSPVLRVPSFVIPSENNFVLNPGHPKFSKIKIRRPEPFFLDRRLYGA